MMLVTKLILILLCGSFALSAQSQPKVITPKKKIALFNGQNLDGWYTWLRENKYEDPQKVFGVSNGMIRISGEQWGGLATRDAYRDFH